MEQDILLRILRSVEKNEKQRWAEIVCTLLLSFATLTSAWCIFQASQWNGEQYFRIEDVNIADRKRMQSELQGQQQKVMDTTLFLSWVAARAEGNEKLAGNMIRRWPPHLAKAVRAWEAADPLGNPSASRTPFDTPEYVLREYEEARRYAEEAARAKDAANAADKHSDTFILLSLILAGVLFITGMSGLTRSFLRQAVLLSVAAFVYCVAFFWLLRLPVII